MQNPHVTFQMNTGRTIVLELLPDQAPNTVRSFLWLARRWPAISSTTNPPPTASPTT